MWPMPTRSRKRMHARRRLSRSTSASTISATARFSPRCAWPALAASSTWAAAMDVSHRVLERAAQRLHLDRMPERQRERISLLHGSLTYRDRRLEGHDAATVVEVIEHLDPERLAAFERVLFEFMQPRTIVLTTPNVEYNVVWESLPAGAYRHRDHRFEWTRAEFQAWATYVAERFGYKVRFLPVGEEHADFGPPSQMGTFSHA